MENLRLAILASGSGSTGEVIFDKAVVVITNNPDAGVIERAKKAHLPCEILSRPKYRVFAQSGEVDKESSALRYGEELLRILEKYSANFVSQNGWSILTPKNVIFAYGDRIVNSHPAPLDPGYPDFGGSGMHGLAVHAAVLYFAQNVGRPFSTEVTLHKAVEDYDKGPLLARSFVKIEGDDTPETLQARVKEIEVRQNVDFWNMVEETGKLVEIKRDGRLILPGEEDLLEEAKRRAVEAYPKG